MSAAAAALTPAGHLTEPAYPPNGGYTEDEAAALRGLAAAPALESGLRKLVADAVASAVFSLFNMLDGTGDPATADDWPPIELVPVDEDSDPAQMLPDAFFESHWTWRERRPDPGWTLDTWAS